MENLQPKDSLMIIQSVINQRKKKYEDNGLVLVFWGVLIMLSGFLQFYMIYNRIYPERSGYVWGILMPLGTIFTIIIKIKDGIKRKEQNRYIDWSEGIWFLGGIGAMVSGFTQSSLKFIIMIIYLPFAMAAMATALQLKNKLWVTTSFVSFLLIYSTIFLQYGLYLPLVASVLGMLLFLIPGIQLYLNYKKRNNV